MITSLSVFTSLESALYACQKVMVPDSCADGALLGLAEPPQAVSARLAATAVAPASRRRRVSTLSMPLKLLGLLQGTSGRRGSGRCRSVRQRMGMPDGGPTNRCWIATAAAPLAQVWSGSGR